MWYIIGNSEMSEAYKEKKMQENVAGCIKVLRPLV